MKKRIKLSLTPRMRDLLVSALDSHVYWQLTDSNDRNNGSSLATSPEIRFAEKMMALLSEAPITKEP